jgi:regulator of sigma E protease
MQDWYYPERGLAYSSLTMERKASSFGEAVRLGKDETIDSLLLVVRFLRKIGTQVSPMSMGGPGTIFAVAGQSAEAGLSHFLLFLCMLSANLAVINFLPIPVLDGGHMMFLAYEGITGKPLNEKWFMRLTYAGFLFILLLMVFVIGLDVNRFVEWIQSLLQ